MQYPTFTVELNKKWYGVPEGLNVKDMNIKTILTCKMISLWDEG
jgi:hypothetical protein